MRRPGDRAWRRAAGTRAVAGVARNRLEVEIGERAPGDEAVARSACPSRRRRSRPPTREHVVRRCARLDTERVGERGLGERVAVARRLDVADARVGRLRRALELERDAHLLLGRHRARAPRATGRASGGVDAVDVGRATRARTTRRARRTPALSRASRSVSSTTSASSEPAHAKPWRWSAIDADADTFDARGRRATRPRRRTPRRRSRACARRTPRPARRRAPRRATRARDLEQLASTHAAVPPTVISRTSTVGWPDDTGTLWPFLPHMPVHVSKSLPTASTHAQHVGTVADQLRGADRPGDLAVLDEVRLGDAEHEVAGGGIRPDRRRAARSRCRSRRRGRCRRDRSRLRAGTCSSCAASAGGGRSRADRCRCSARPSLRARTRSHM